jgi:hypothetical protein
MRMNRNVQTPVSFVISEMGFALRLPFNPFQARRKTGSRHTPKTNGLTDEDSLLNFIVAVWA